MTDRTTPPFLQELAKDLLATHNRQIGRLTVVFPNRRAGYFFRKYLGGLIKSPLWSPEIYSIEDFIAKHSSLLEADRITLIFTLYQVYKKQLGYDEGFDAFYGWGEMLLGDFDEIDRYLVNAKSLFQNMLELKRIDAVFAFMDENQRRIVHNFWRTFSGELSAEKRTFLRLWANLYAVYLEFKRKLAEQDLAYTGMIYREVAEALQAGDSFPFGQVIFAGFNALTRSEEQIMAAYLKNKKAKVYWDMDQAYLQDQRQEAGMFLRRYRGYNPFAATFKGQAMTDMRAEAKQIDLIGVPHDSGQAKKAGEILQDLYRKGQLKQPEKTVVVLANEAMLFPMLYSLPIGQHSEGGPDIPINVTMGYPLRETSLYGLLEQLVEMQDRATRGHDGQAPITYHYRYLISVLRHPLVYYRMPEEADDILDDIEAKNRLSISAEELTATHRPAQLRTLFRVLQDSGDIIPYLLDVLKDIRIHRLAGLQPTGQADLELEYIFAFESHLKRLSDTLNSNRLSISIETFLRLYRSLVRTLRVPFSGEPLNGLQIMGMLETRNLDFDHVIVLNMNEGVFPPVAATNSYVPNALRRAFGLSTPDHADAVSANVFYHLLQRASHITLLYNATISTQNSGGLSRFLYQLMYEKPDAWQLRHQVISNAVKGREPVAITIPKSPAILSGMNKWLQNGGQGGYSKLTASALNAYLDCRLKFYFRYVARLKEAEEVEEEVDQRIFGNILHETMEYLYKGYIKRKGSPLIDLPDFEPLKKRLPETIDQSFARHYGLEGRPFRFEGRNVIARSIVRQMAQKVLDKDREDAPFEIIGLEKDDYDLPMTTDRGVVTLTGIIDRVDKKGEHIRVIDYKTGQDNKQVSSIESLFDRKDPKRNKAALQTFLYGFLYKTKQENAGEPVMAGLYNVKELFNKDFSMTLTMDKKPVMDVSLYEEPYMAGLKGLLNEIFNTEQEFDQTDDEKKCRTCPYNVICHR